MRTSFVSALLLLFSDMHVRLTSPQPIADVGPAAEIMNCDDVVADMNVLAKRKGGGAGGARGSGSSRSGKGGSEVRGGSGSTTSSRSGIQPSYGGGRYYGGGAMKPYSAGARSPSGIVPVFLGIGLLSIYPGLWLYGAYQYQYSHPYSFYNRTESRNVTNTRTTTPTRSWRVPILISILGRQSSSIEGVNETKSVYCLCAAYSACGCDDPNNMTILDSIIGDGTYANLNKSLVTVADVNGTSSILLNGTLPNGTNTNSAPLLIPLGNKIPSAWLMPMLVTGAIYLI